MWPYWNCAALKAASFSRAVPSGVEGSMDNAPVVCWSGTLVTVPNDDGACIVVVEVVAWNGDAVAADVVNELFPTDPNGVALLDCPNAGACVGCPNAGACVACPKAGAAKGCPHTEVGVDGCPNDEGAVVGAAVCPNAEVDAACPNAEVVFEAVCPNAGGVVAVDCPKTDVGAEGCPKAEVEGCPNTEEAVDG